MINAPTRYFLQFFANRGRLLVTPKPEVYVSSQQFLVVNVSGPSGVGKTAVCKEVLRELPWLKRSISVTTRRPRPGEQSGVDYHFVRPDEFRDMIERNEFVEHMPVHGYHYGTSERFVNELRNVPDCRGALLAIDWQGNVELKRRLRGVVSIMLVPPSLQVLEARLRGRGTDPADVITRRLEAAVHELRQHSSFDHFVVNDDLDETMRAVAAICENPHTRTPHGLWEIENVLAGRRYNDNG